MYIYFATLNIITILRVVHAVVEEPEHPSKHDTTDDVVHVDNHEKEEEHVRVRGEDGQHGEEDLPREFRATEEAETRDTEGKAEEPRSLRPRT